MVSQCYWNVVLLISISDSHLHYFYTERNFLNKIRKITFYSFWCIYTFDEAFCQKSVPFFQISSVFSVERFDRSRQYFIESTAWAIKSTKRLVRWNMRFTSEAYCLNESHQMLLLRCRFWISYLDLGIKRLIFLTFNANLKFHNLMYWEIHATFKIYVNGIQIIHRFIAITYSVL